MPIAPVINLNGESAEILIENHLTAIQYAKAFRRALVRAHPHPRDFQTVSADVLLKASREADDRLHALDAIIADLEAITLDLASQADRINAARK